MRPVLRSAEGRVLLSRRTTIGRHGCNVNLTSPQVDRSHAVIEVHEHGTSGGAVAVLLTDLNTTHGTYVNDSRVQNATVRLAHGDVIRFGHGTSPYHFELESAQSTSGAASPSLLPNLASTSGHMTSTPTRATPLPTSLFPTASNATPGLGASHLAGRRTSPMLSAASSDTNLLTMSTVSAMTDREKNEKLLGMGDEINRLVVFENECHRKDVVIGDLRRQLTHYSQTANDNDKQVGHLATKVQHLESRRDTDKTQLATYRDQAELVPGLRKELSQRRQTITTLTDERKKLHQELADLQVTASQLQKELADKNATAGMLRSEMTVLRAHRSSGQKEVDDLRQCVIVQETLAEERGRSAAKLTSEVDQLKKALLQSTSLNKEMERMRAELAAESSLLQHKETECNRLSDKMTEFARRVISQTASDGASNDSTDVREVSMDTAMIQLETAMAEKKDKEEELATLQTEHDEDLATQETTSNFLTNLETCLNFSAEDLLSAPAAERLEQLRGTDAPERWQSIKEKITELADTAVGLKTKLSSLVQSVTEAGSALADVETEAAPATVLQLLQRRIVELVQAKKDMEQHLLHARQEHEQSLASLTTALQKEATADKSATAAECQVQVDEATRDAVTRTLADRQAVEQELGRTIAELEQAMQASVAECQQYKESCGRLQQQLDNSREETIKLQKELSAEPARIAAACNAVHKKCAEEVSLHMEVSRQHSLTIVSLEERLLAAAKETEQAKDAAVAEKSVLQSKGGAFSTAVDVDEGSHSQLAARQQLLTEVKGLQRLLDVSRRDVSTLQAQLREQMGAAYGLRRDLAGASSQLSDERVKHERDSAQLERQLKQELGIKEETVQRQTGEIRALKDMTERYRGDLEAQLAETQYLHQLLDASHGVESEQREELKTTRQKWKSGVRAHCEELSSLKDKHQKTFSLAEIGARCQAQDHDRVIRDQGTALAALRRGADTQSSSRHLGSGGASQELLSLQQQLAESNAKLTLHNTSSLATAAETKASINSVKSESDIIRNQLQAERQAQQELLEALEDGEKSYLSLVRAAVRTLGIEPQQGARSVVGLTRQQRSPIMQDREKTQEVLVSRIAAVTEKITRKERLLESYEEDLTKLRRLEGDSAAKSSKLASLEMEVASKAQEINMLRESFHRVQEELDQQMRLNTSLRTRQLYKESQTKQPAPPPHSCLTTPAEVNQKMSSQRHGYREQLRRKDLELRTLKHDLATKDGQLQATLSRLGKSGP